MAQATYPKVWRTEQARTRIAAQLPPYLVLLRVGFAVPRALLRERCALTAPFHPYLGLLTAEAVCSLLRFPSNGLEPAIPDVIRHTALWSSDFPLSSCEDSDHPICYQLSYYRWFLPARLILAAQRHLLAIIVSFRWKVRDGFGREERIQYQRRH